MWFRVELNKDGGIASCKQVSGSFESSRYVRYIEADSAKSATALAAKWWIAQQKRNEVSMARYRRLANARICVMCATEKARRGRKSCAACAKKHIGYTLRKRAEIKDGIRVDHRIDPTRDASQKYLDAEERKKKYSVGQRKRVVLRARLASLEEVFSRWQRDGSQMFVWLQGEIAALQTQLSGQSKVTGGPRARLDDAHATAAE